ncbi:MAG: LVIVD repeat-containing protein [Gemmatimonadota bacterium]
MRSEAKRLLSVMIVQLAIAATASAQDARVGLKAGWTDAGSASHGLELVAHVDRPAGFFDPDSLGNILLANSDMAFRGNHLFLGSFHGFQIYDISDPRKPQLRTAFVCPGGQGDLSVHRNLLFMSVEMPNARIDCGTQGSMTDSVSATRFRGVRIFDISDLTKPRQVAAIQTCRGSHTHTLVPDPKDTAHVYIYVSGASMVRPAAELAGCSGLPPQQDPNTSYFRIEVIKVPVAAPQTASIVNAPRIFANPQTGDIAGLWKGGTHGANTQETAVTDQCHDITAYPEIGLAAGACSGNGILLDISDPANPVRVAEVVDPNFAYWHSATFNNDASRVLFTDEWGGGLAPRCRNIDPERWGADAIFTLANRKLQHVGYYKLPAPQDSVENCVAHNGSLIPVPGRDIMAQAWYQGGVSVFDFTDPARPVEIAYFDRGPYSATELLLGGFWSAYWYNGYIYGSEIGRGLDVFRLTPSERLSDKEIAAADVVRVAVFNPQTQTRLVWPASFAVARAYLDQLKRSSSIPAARIASITSELDRAERMEGAARRDTLNQLAATVASLGSAPRSARLLAQTLTHLASATTR